MKKKAATKIMSYLLTTAMVVGGLSLSPLATVEVRADATTKIVNLRLDNNSIAGIENPTSGKNGAGAWAGTTVYYGNKEYYVLDRNGQSKNRDDSVRGHSSMEGHMLLFSKAVIEGGGINFDSTTSDSNPATSDWAESDIRNALNDGYFYNKVGVFTVFEKGAISATPINSTNTENTYSDGTTTPGSTSYPSVERNDRIFLLDYDDVYNKNYGFSRNDANHNTRKADAGMAEYVNDKIMWYWWLRSPDFFGTTHYAYMVSRWGGVSKDAVNNAAVTYFARPAFNLDLSKVLFSIVPGAGYDTFSSIAVTDSNIWKLVLQGTTTTLNPTKTSGNTSLQPGYSEETLEIGHTAANTVLTGDIAATQVSAMLTDSNGTVLYYGKINDNTATNSNVIIPAGLTEGNYKLYVFAEQVNAENLTNYASALGTPIAITVGNPPTPTPQPSPSKSDDSEKPSDTQQNNSNQLENTNANPLTLGFSIGNTDGNTTGNSVGNSNIQCIIEKPGPICAAAFKAATPTSFVEAFTFSMLGKDNGTFKTSSGKKTGEFTLNIPPQYRKAGRSFALIGIDQYGHTKIFTDTDLSSDSITVKLDLEGYAFSVIYTDTGATVPSGNTTTGAGSGDYTIKAGDTLSTIARKLGVSVKYLMEKNKLKNPDKLRINQKIEY